MYALNAESTKSHMPNLQEDLALTPTGWSRDIIVKTTAPRLGTAKTAGYAP